MYLKHHCVAKCYALTEISFKYRHMVAALSVKIDQYLHNSAMLDIFTVLQECCIELTAD